MVNYFVLKIEFFSCFISCLFDRSVSRAKELSNEDFPRKKNELILTNYIFEWRHKPVQPFFLYSLTIFVRYNNKKKIIGVAILKSDFELLRIDDQKYFPA